MTINKTDREDEKIKKLCNILIVSLLKATKDFTSSLTEENNINGQNLFDTMSTIGLAYLNIQIVTNIKYLIHRGENPSNYINIVKEKVHEWLLNFDNEFNQGEFKA